MSTNANTKPENLGDFAGAESLDSVLKKITDIGAARSRLDDAGCDPVFPPFRIALLGAPGRGQVGALEKIASALKTAGLIGDSQVASVALWKLAEHFPGLAPHDGTGDGERISDPRGALIPAHGSQAALLIASDVDFRAERVASMDPHDSELQELRKAITDSRKTLNNLVSHPQALPAVALLGDLDLRKELWDNQRLADDLFAVIEFPAPTPEELFDAVKDSLEETGRALGDDGRRSLTAALRFRSDVLSLEDAPRIALKASLLHAVRIGSGQEKPGVLGAPDVAVFAGGKNRTDDEILKSFDSFVGLEEVKQKVADMVALGKERQRRIDKGHEVDLNERMFNFAFVGPPGTGKTSVARLMGELLYAASILPSPKVNTVTRADLTGQYLGESEQKTAQVIKASRGGVLFLDEAYSLTESNFASGRDPYGRAVMGQLVEAMTSNAGQMAFIFAGYEPSMESFFDANEGIRSRIQDVVHFRNMTVEELVDVFRLRLEKFDPPARVDEEALAIAKKVLGAMLGASDPATFGNARAAESLALTARTRSPRNEEGIVDTVTAQAIEDAGATMLPEARSGSSSSSGEASDVKVTKQTVERARKAINAAWVSPYVRAEIELVIDELENSRATRRRGNSGLSRSVVDLFIDGADAGQLGELAGALLALHQEAGLLAPDGEVVALEAPDSVSGVVDAVDEQFDSAGGGVVVIAPAEEVLKGFADIRMAAVAILDRMRRDRNTIMVLFGGDASKFSALEGTEAILREVEIKPEGWVDL